MPRLIIDNRPVEVESGLKVIDAAERLGIMIPRFCYHPALGAVGACRVCAVMFVEGPVKGLKMSCMVDAADGMVVSTEDPQAVAFRCQVIEWLMRNHPHDCPVCDEGGHCLLQDMTIAGGHGLRFSEAPKRTHLDQYLGPLVQHEMNRCIQCYRCVRYYREHSGYRDLGVMGSASRVYYGRHENGPLDSPFAGNLIDLCPTGVFTDKPARYKGRRWDLNRTPSVCTACGLGCNLTVSSRYREMVRHEARLNPAVNGHFICDRGRFAHAHANLQNRPRQARLNGHPLSGDPLETAARELQQVIERHGPQAVAWMGSARANLESLLALRQICQAGGYRGPLLENQPGQTLKDRVAVAGLEPHLNVDSAALEKADLILAVGVAPLNEAPMLAMRLRQAVRQDAHLIVLDPRPVNLPCPMEHLSVAPDALEDALNRLNGQVQAHQASPGEGPETAANDPLTALAHRLATSRCPMLVCGTRLPTSGVIAATAHLAQTLHASNSATGLIFTLPEVNSFAAALLADPTLDAETLLAEIENGRIKALVTVENDPLGSFPDRPRWQAALERLDFWIVLDHLPTASMTRASLAVPCANIYESGGLFLNHTGLLQQAQKALAGGTPVRQTGQGDHPPRGFDETTRGPILTTSATQLQQLAQKLALAGELAADLPNWLQTALAGHEPGGLDAVLPAHGQRVVLTDEERPQVQAAPVTSFIAQETPPFLTVIWNDTFLGSDPFSGFAPWLQQSDTGPLAYIHSRTAAEMNLTHGTRIQIDTTPIGLVVVDNMAPGCIVLPRHRDWPWQDLEIENGRLARNRVLTLEFESGA